MSDNWMKQLRNLSDDYRKAAPEGLLGDIKEEMARRGLSPAAATGPARLSVMGMRRWVAAAVVALLAGVAVVGLWPDGQDMPSVASAPTTAPVVSRTVKKQEPAASVSSDLSPAFALVHQLRQSVANKVLHVGQLATAAPQPGMAVVSSDASTETLAEMHTESSSPAPKMPEYGRPLPSQGHHDSSAALLAAAGHKSRNGRASGTWHVGAYYGNTGSMPSLTTEDAEAPMYNAMSDYFANGLAPLEDKSVVAAPPAVTSEHHRRPVRIGLSVRYRLTPRWSLQSGLIYSYLSSDFTTDKGYSTVVTHQKLHYVGVPLTASYSLWQGRKVNVYASAGGMVEQLVSGRARAQETLVGQKQPATTDKVSENRPVLSTQGVLGIEYQATHRLSIYAEPGVSYYFGNGSDIRSSYTDKPFNLNLNLGVRLNIR